MKSIIADAWIYPTTGLEASDHAFLKIILNFGTFGTSYFLRTRLEIAFEATDSGICALTFDYQPNSQQKVNDSVCLPLPLAINFPRLGGGSKA